MKNALLIAALTMASASAFATKAREGSLQRAQTVNPGTQYVLVRPSLLGYMPEFAVFEFGGTSGISAAGAASKASVNAEGGLFRKMGDSTLGVYFGAQPSSFGANGLLGGGVGGWATSFIPSAAAGADLYYMDNPMNVFYQSKAGDMLWGATLYYAASERKDGDTATGTSSSNKKSASGVNLSVDTADYWAIANIGLGFENKRTSSADKSSLKSKTGFMVGGGLFMDKIVPYAYVISKAFEYKNASDTTAANLESSIIDVGVESKIKGDGYHFYYGALYESIAEKEKESNTKFTMSWIPVYMGIEADAASWLVLRASLTQPVLMSSTKMETATTTPVDRSMSNATTVATSAGFKFNKFLLDWTMNAGTTGTLSTTDFGSNAALTYFF